MKSTTPSPSRLAREQRNSEIRALRREGLKPDEIAKRFGVHPNTVRNACKAAEAPEPITADAAGTLPGRLTELAARLPNNPVVADDALHQAINKVIAAWSSYTTTQHVTDYQALRDAIKQLDQAHQHPENGEQN